MKRLVECVPNISEGRDLAKVNRIADTVRAVSGVRLLDVDPNADYNRSVITFAGEPEACVEALFRLSCAAFEGIDMSTHLGSHPRSGAVDVAPFVPVSNISMGECVELSRRYGQRIGTECGVPVYLYEAAATRPERANLAKVRSGEYEALEEKLKLAEWKPDFGPTKFNAKSGCVITGARFFLVAFNVNLRTDDVKLTNDIALHIREMGWPLQDDSGTDILNAARKKIFHPGPLRHTKAMGVYLDDDKFCQVSINLTNYLVTAPHIALEQVRHEASARDIEVFGSEVVGLIPLEAILLAANYYIWRNRLPRPKTERAAIELVHDAMLLSSFRPFEPRTKIIEYALQD